MRLWPGRPRALSGPPDPPRPLATSLVAPATSPTTLSSTHLQAPNPDLGATTICCVPGATAQDSPSSLRGEGSQCGVPHPTSSTWNSLEVRIPGPSPDLLKQKSVGGGDTFAVQAPRTAQADICHLISQVTREPPASPKKLSGPPFCCPIRLTPSCHNLWGLSPRDPQSSPRQSRDL